MRQGRPIVSRQRMTDPDAFPSTCIVIGYSLSRRSIILSASRIAATYPACQYAHSDVPSSRCLPALNRFASSALPIRLARTRSILLTAAKTAESLFIGSSLPRQQPNLDALPDLETLAVVLIDVESNQPVLLVLASQI